MHQLFTRQWKFQRNCQIRIRYFSEQISKSESDILWNQYKNLNKVFFSHSHWRQCLTNTLDTMLDYFLRLCLFSWVEKLFTTLSHGQPINFVYKNLEKPNFEGSQTNFGETNSCLQKLLRNFSNILKYNHQVHNRTLKLYCNTSFCCLNSI